MSDHQLVGKHAPGDGMSGEALPVLRDVGDRHAATPSGAPTVSVVITCLDAEEFLGTALASLAAQSRQADEVIVVDDGSTDGTVAVAQDWASRLPLTIVRLPINVGVGGARRAGVERSTGDLVALLDADDYWLPDHLAVMLRCHAEHGGIVTASNYRWVPEQRIGDQPSSVLIPVPPPHAQRDAILQWNFVYAGSLFSRSLYEEVGGFRPVVCEDWDLWIRMIRAGGRVVTPETVTVLYRMHSASITKGDTMLTGTISLLEDLLPTVEPNERKLVRRALRRGRGRWYLLTGCNAMQDGRTAAARAWFLRAAWADRSLRGSPTKIGGSTTVRALACLAFPRRMIAVRDDRLSDGGVLVGHAGIRFTQILRRRSHREQRRRR